MKRRPGRLAVARTSRNSSGRQACVEREAGPGVQVQPVALPPDVRCRVTLVHLDVDTGPHQPLGETQATQAGPRHRHPQSTHRVP